MNLAIESINLPLNNKMEFIDLKTQQDLIKKDLNSRIEKVLSHGQYIMGPEVEELERKLATYTGSKHCVTVSSGTDALLISLMGLNIGHGDEVITSPLTWVSTAEVIVLLGAKPVFVDIDPQTCNIDHSKIEKKISSKTKAIIPVSLYGQPCDMTSINNLADKYKLPVLEDAAQSFGAMFENKKSCNLSTIGCTSFFPSKPLGCYGDGGAIFTDSDDLAKIFKEIRLNGQENKNKFNRIGIQGRLDTLQAAILLAKMEVFPKEVQLRYEIGRKYDELFDLAGINHVKQRINTKSVYAQYTIFSDNRDELSKTLLNQEIPTSVYYSKPIYYHPPYDQYRADCNLVEKIADKIISLPMHPYLKESVQEKIVNIVKDFQLKF